MIGAYRSYVVGDPEYTPRENGRHKEADFTLSPDEEFAWQVFLNFGEILTSYGCLRNIEVYLRRFPYAKTGITRGSYIRYHAENYLHEYHCMTERIKKFITYLKRRYKNSRYKKSFEISLPKEIPLVDVRNDHVHNARYSSLPIAALEFCEILERLRLDETGWYESTYDEAFRKARKDTISWVKGNNDMWQTTLDDLFSTLSGRMFREDGTLIYPDIYPEPAEGPKGRRTRRR